MFILGTKIVIIGKLSVLIRSFLAFSGKCSNSVEGKVYGFKNSLENYRSLHFHPQLLIYKYTAEKPHEKW